jgi:sec-independent protein translocase protein TatA
MGGLTPAHLILVLVVALFVLGPGKLPEVGAALGKSIREFRKATTDIQEATGFDLSSSPAVPPAIRAAAATPASDTTVTVEPPREPGT